MNEGMIVGVRGRDVQRSSVGSSVRAWCLSGHLPIDAQVRRPLDTDVLRS